MGVLLWGPADFYSGRAALAGKIPIVPAEGELRGRVAKVQFPVLSFVVRGDLIIFAKDYTLVQDSKVGLPRDASVRFKLLKNHKYRYTNHAYHWHSRRYGVGQNHRSPQNS